MDQHFDGMASNPIPMDPSLAFLLLALVAVGAVYLVRRTYNRIHRHDPTPPLPY